MNEKLGDGILSRNKNKYEIQNGKWAVLPGAEKRPDYTGQQTLKVAGGEVKIYISGWIRKANKDGSPFLSLQFEYAKNETRRLTIAQPIAGTMPPAPPDGLPEVDTESLPF